MDTIFALSTAPGKAGVSIVRVSGPDAFRVSERICGKTPTYRIATLRQLIDLDGEPLDEALVLAFEKDHSFTGENTVEFQIHGSTAILSALQDHLASINGVRQADPGEFTRRAMENGRLDLARVEGLADLIDAETEAQRKQAQRVFSGALGSIVSDWRQDLIRAAALIEATIDFADEEVPEDVFPEVRSLLTHVNTSMQAELDRSAVSERIRTGFEVAIIGPPNIGKSTLLNRLAGRDAAITSEYAGTTRDVIEIRMDLKGLPVTILDTAGLRETEDYVEAVGIERTRERALAADLRVALIAPGTVPEIPLTDDDLIVLGKADVNTGEGLAVSGKTGEGVTEVIEAITNVLSQRAARPGLAVRDRHREAMRKGLGYLGQALDMLENGAGADDLIAEELRSAVRALDSVIGKVDVEAVLDEIFSSFCLGK